MSRGTPAEIFGRTPDENPGTIPTRTSNRIPGASCEEIHNEISVRFCG